MTLENKLFLHAFSKKKQKEANKLLTKSDHTCGKRTAHGIWPIKSFWAEYSGLIKIAKSDLTKYHGLSYRDDPVYVRDGDELGLG